MVGIRISFWDVLSSGAEHVSFREYIHISYYYVTSFDSSRPLFLAVSVTKVVRFDHIKWMQFSNGSSWKIHREIHGILVMGIVGSTSIANQEP